MNPGLPADDRRHLFVYGTLRPGDVRWHILSPFVAGGGRPDTAAGTLYDTGLGYPAATFGGDGTLVGLTYELRPATRERCLAVLDEVEGTVAGLYRRISITTGLGFDAWTYEYGGGLTLEPIASGDWAAR